MLQSMGAQRVGHDWATEQQHHLISELFHHSRRKRKKKKTLSISSHSPISFPYPLATTKLLSGSISAYIAQSVKNLPAMQETQVHSWVGKILWRRKWQSTPVFLPGKSHGQRSLVGYSPWGCKVRHDLATKPPSPHS